MKHTYDEFLYLINNIDIFSSYYKIKFKYYCSMINKIAFITVKNKIIFKNFSKKEKSKIYILKFIHFQTE